MNFRDTIKNARQIAQVPRMIQGEDWYSQFFTRYFTIYISVPLYKLGVSANAVTVWMGIVCLLGSICIVFDSVWLVLLGGLLWQLWYILDCVDGEIARLSKKTSLLGVYIDKLTHIFVNPTISLAFGLHVYFKERTIVNAVCTLLIYSAYTWRASILKARMQGEHENLVFKAIQFNKRSILGILRLIISPSFGEAGQVITFSAVLILSYLINYNFVGHFLHIYTIVFLCYIIILTSREVIEVRKLDLEKQSRKGIKDLMSL
jgi:phosphatidylglycerophosphate synthase